MGKAALAFLGTLPIITLSPAGRLGEYSSRWSKSLSVLERLRKLLVRFVTRPLSKKRVEPCRGD